MIPCLLQLDIVGHSGDSDEIPFVESSNPPSNDKERLKVLKVGCTILRMNITPDSPLSSAYILHN